MKIPRSIFMILKSKTIQGVPKNMGIQLQIQYRLWYELALLIPDFKSHNIIMSARVYYIKTVNDCKDVILMLRKMKMNSEDGQVYSVCILYFLFVLLILQITAFLVGYHCTKSKNYLRRRYRICHWIPMFIVTPCK